MTGARPDAPFGSRWLAADVSVVAGDLAVPEHVRRVQRPGADG